jgi:[ribosomal protein S5]-alanine N-acetyltransferase
VCSPSNPKDEYRKSVAIAGDGICLRSPTRRDGKQLMALNRASTRFHRGLVSPPKQPEQFASFLRRFRQPDTACLLLHRCADDAVIGSINLSQIFLGGFRNAYLGYYIGAR